MAEAWAISWRIMNALAFVSAYKLLQPSEVAFVDEFLRALEQENSRQPLERITTTLERFASTLDTSFLDDRSRDHLAKPLVKAAIRERVEDLARERDLTPQRIIREHAAIAVANMADYVTIGEDGMPTVDMQNASRVDWSAVQQIESEETYGPGRTTRKVKLKLYNKQVSLDALAKWSGLDKSENPEWLAYRAAPEVAALPATADLETVAERYARMLDD